MKSFLHRVGDFVVVIWILGFTFLAGYRANDPVRGCVGEDRIYDLGSHGPGFYTRSQSGEVAIEAVSPVSRKPETKPLIEVKDYDTAGSVVYWVEHKDQPGVWDLAFPFPNGHRDQCLTGRNYEKIYWKDCRRIRGPLPNPYDLPEATYPALTPRPIPDWDRTGNKPEVLGQCRYCIKGVGVIEQDKYGFARVVCNCCGCRTTKFLGWPGKNPSQHDEAVDAWQRGAAK